MNASNRFVAVVLIVAIALTASPAPLAAQSADSCAAAIDKLFDDTNRLGAELDADVRQFVKDDAADTALKGLREKLKNKPAANAVFEVKDQWEKFKTWTEYARAMQVSMDDLGQCINTRGCSLIEFARRQNQALKEWSERLAEEGLSKANDRVAKAAKLLKNYVERTLNLATNGTLGAVNMCVTRYEQQATTSNTAANQPAQPTPQGGGAKVSGGGGGSGKAIGLAVAAGGAVAGALYASKLASDLGEELFTPTTTTTTGGGTTNTGGGTTSSTANYTAAVDTRTCTGNSTIEPCNSSPETTGTCNALSFTVSVSGGQVSSCRNWLSGTISGGTFTGTYQGSCGANPGPAVSGSIPGTVSGTSNCRGNQYTIRMTIR